MRNNGIKMLTVDELADVLHVAEGTIRNRLSAGEPIPPSITVGRKLLFPEAKLETWLMAKLVSNDDGFKQDPNPFCSKKDVTNE